MESSLDVGSHRPEDEYAGSSPDGCLQEDQYDSAPLKEELQEDGWQAEDSQAHIIIVFLHLSCIKKSSRALLKNPQNTE